MLGISTLALGLASHGWYVFYVFVLLSEHTLKYAAFGQFWTVYLLPVLGIACCALVLGARRTPLVLVAGCAALVVESYAALVHSGGRVNDMLPAYLAVALLAGLAMGDRARRPGGPGRGPAGPRPGSRAGAPGLARPVGRRRGRRPGHRAAGRADERLPSGPGDPGERGPRRRAGG